MGIVKISDNVYSVGVINPSLRVFDIVMQAKYGTSYNAYLVTGKKNVLIETVHEDYFEEYIYNIGCLVDVKDIDYIVMNHTELDHSGSLLKLLSINPDITVVCTNVANKYLKSILNKDFKCKAVKHEETLDLGDKSLKFIVAPLLHWPDSMMTYLENDKVLFSCDFLGCHFCEPTMFDSNIKYKNEYLGEFKYYYDAIFGPFKPYVLAGLEKIKDLLIEIICPSHGPVLVCEIKERLDDYKRWSTKKDKQNKTIVIGYASAYGCTKKLAEKAFDTVKNNSNVEPILIDVVSTPLDELSCKINDADALLIGSCTINRDAPKFIWDALSSIDAINTKSKAAGAFGSYGWSGEAVDMIKSRLSQLKYKFIGDGVKANFQPTDDDLKSMEDYCMQILKEIK